MLLNDLPNEILDYILKLSYKFTNETSIEQLIDHFKKSCVIRKNLKVRI